MLSWTWLFAMWLGLLAVLTVIWFFYCFKNSDFKLPSVKDKLKPTWQSLSIYIVALLLVFTFIILFLKGGYFIGDQQHHLAYIIKHLHNSIITPYAPMYEGTTEIPYNYAYDINYLYLSAIVKITGVNLNLFWDISPAFYFIIFFSAYTLLYRNVVHGYDHKKFFSGFCSGFYSGSAL